MTLTAGTGRAAYDRPRADVVVPFAGTRRGPRRAARPVDVAVAAPRRPPDRRRQPPRRASRSPACSPPAPSPAPITPATAAPRSATNPWLVFIDADVEPPPTLVDDYLAAPIADDCARARRRGGRRARRGPPVRRRPLRRPEEADEPGRDAAPRAVRLRPDRQLRGPPRRVRARRRLHRGHPLRRRRGPLLPPARGRLDARRAPAGAGAPPQPGDAARAAAPARAGGRRRALARGAPPRASRRGGRCRACWPATRCARRGRWRGATRSRRSTRWPTPPSRSAGGFPTGSGPREDRRARRRVPRAVGDLRGQRGARAAAARPRRHARVRQGRRRRPVPGPRAAPRARDRRWPGSPCGARSRARATCATAAAGGPRSSRATCARWPASPSACAGVDHVHVHFAAGPALDGAAARAPARRAGQSITAHAYDIFLTPLQPRAQAARGRLRDDRLRVQRAPPARSVGPGRGGSTRS